MNVNDLMVADQHEEGVWMTLKGPDGKEVKGAQVLIVGPYSETYQQRQRDYYRRNVHKAAALFAASEGDEKAAEEATQDDMVLLQAMWCAKEFKGLTDSEGNEWKPEEDDLRQLLTKAPYIKADIYNTFRKTENFTGS